MIQNRNLPYKSYVFCQINRLIIDEINSNNRSNLLIDVCWLWAAVSVSGTEYVERGETIRLQCNASGKPDPPHDLHWLHNDSPVRSDPSTGVLVSKKIETKYLLSVLTIERSRFSDAGDYACVTSWRRWLRLCDVQRWRSVCRRSCPQWYVSTFRHVMTRD